MYEFLTSLPALLGICGFIVYQLIKSREQNGEISLKIIDKLRQDLPERFENRDKLSSKQLFDLLQEDNVIRDRISDQDFRLLQHSITTNFIKELCVYALVFFCIVFSIAGYVYLSAKADELEVSGMQLHSIEPVAKGRAVDLDTLKLVWSSSGNPKELRVYLENVDTKLRSYTLNVNSAEGAVEFTKDDYSEILNQRSPGGWNRVRAVMKTEDRSFFSSEFKLYVGITIIAVNFGEKITIGAMIDNRSVQGYNFDAKLVVWRKDSVDAISFDGGISNGQRSYPIDKSYLYDWAGAKLVYLGPDDGSLIRTRIEYDAEQLAEAEEADKVETAPLVQEQVNDNAVNKDDDFVSEPDRVAYKIEMFVDKYKSVSGRGWDYPLIEPDPFPCIGEDREEKHCYDVNQPDWKVCQNQNHCTLMLRYKPLEKIIVWLYDRDDGNLLADGHDEVGSGVCSIGVECRLENSQSGINAGSVLVSRLD